MAKYFPYLNVKKINKDGHTPLYVCYNYNRTKRTLIATGFSIKPIFWDEKKKWIKRSCPEFEEISDVLTKITSKLGEILVHAKDNMIDPTIDFVLNELEKNREYEQRSNRVDLFKVLDQYIEERTPFVSKDQVKDYNSLKKHLRNFKEYSTQPISFKSLNLKFYNELLDYLYNKTVKRDGSVGLLTNSAGKIVKLLKAFVNYQISKGTIPMIDLKIFKVMAEETDAIYLSETELKDIYCLDLSNDVELDNIRDIFILGCFTGLRYSDLSSLTEGHFDFKNKMINIKQRKVHRAVVIPMIDYVPDILKKHDNDLPKIPSYKFNERVKELGEKINLNQQIEIIRKKGNQRVSSNYKKYELISSHTCRRSFCTNMHLAGSKAEELMKISGHKSPMAFMRYVKVDNLQAARQLMERRERRRFETI